ncbi:MAG: colanic acid biosynthesis acetyltransferase WcaF [Microcoleus sp. PH2017_01_SCD_O_A]|uniref:hormogonium polysaccharide biosynthesis acetyltransferase HpsU n=1 Tax=unclassified Microcoleus TaxID=2642155 RepID=UPI001DFF3EF5|nr:MULTISPECIES: hormogonium polysaccharide biosynthesis acetyltransferase HpsU [unclassified Microcoleus]MCC3418793.1 colanic acid biosynthesis acetyltransferase WcaF [Microcoleus sp. PH2017_07_MST_O_A]MCC3502237.1 colanic acid biosynthesis acetyltransferase WcaF [Microcoleus sp. PH2017_19_SFW_U_A]MCC3513915.1 colanic acid biosynthesis acetyltransferase WcaF [Microcoleus sp. PH2017_17_BER_D_A]TAE53629.1 MAG: colanic acid biosynthesis acetyltransferase WcaF [Oscillatoriales cyanobacterium]MCC3
MTHYTPSPDPEPPHPIANSPNPEINDRPIGDNQPNILTGESLIDLRLYNQSNFDRGRRGWLILLWWLVQAIAFPLTPHPCNSIRSALLRLFGAKIGFGVIIRPTARFTYPWKIEIGDYSWIGDDVVLYSLDRIAIGKHCVISQKSYLCTGTHDPQDPAFGLITASVIINNGVWIAADCFIGPGVAIGANALIGARSSVFENMPAGFVCTGTPCRPRDRREINKSL